MVRLVGLEPTRAMHTHLKRTCLPIPAQPHIAIIYYKKTHLLSNNLRRVFEEFLIFFIYFGAKQKSGGLAVDIYCNMGRRNSYRRIRRRTFWV